MRTPVQVPDILDEREYHWPRASGPFLHGLAIGLFWRFHFSGKSGSWVR